MQAIKPQYIKDEKGEILGVFLSETEFEYLMKERKKMGELDVCDETKIDREKFVSLKREELKAMVKATMIEVLVERKGWFMEAFQEALEDIYLGMAMDEAKEGDYVSREEVFATLNED